MKPDAPFSFHYDALHDAVAMEDEIQKNPGIVDWLDNLPVKIVIADAEGKADFWNKQWYDYTGLAPDYPKNKVWKAALHPDDIQRTFNAMFYSVRTGKELQIEYRLKRASDGQYRWHMAHAQPLANRETKIYRWLVAVIDIHEQKEAEQNKDIFLSVASHEIKTPLTTLKTLLHVYKNETSADSLYAGIFERAESQLLRIERIVGNLQDVARISAHKLIYRFEEFHFSEMMKESIERMQQQIHTHTLVLEQNAKLLFVGDRMRLEQLFDNLLSNAVKYSPSANKVVVKSYVIENDIIVAVQDFGIGIEPDNIDKIYTPYYRVNHASPEFEGLGMGLYICSEIVKNHLGRLWVNSTPGQGSTFYCSLPISKLSPY